MIHSIKIENYQSHRDTELVLSPGLNVIVGPGSNIGKSAILRAVNWLASNRPLGDRFMFKLGKEEAIKTRVHVSFDEWLVTRIKTKDFNGYHILAKTKNQEPVVFDKIGTEVPEKLKVILASEGVNYQNQLSPHFLIRESPGEIGRVLNEATNLVAIDKVMKWFERAVRETKGKIKFVEQELEKERRELERYRSLKELKPKVDSLIATYASFDELVSLITEVEKVLHRRQAVIDDLVKLRQRVKGSKVVDELIVQCEEWLGLKSVKERLDELWESRVLLTEKHKQALLELVRLRDEYQFKEEELKRKLVELGFCPVCKAKLTEATVSHLLREEKVNGNSL